MRSVPLYRALMGVVVVFLLLGLGGTTLAAPGARRAIPAGPREISGREALLPPWASDESPALEIQAGPIEPALLRQLLAAEQDDTFRVMVHLRQRVDLRTATQEDGLTGVAARSRVLSALQSTADRSQGLLRAYLTGAQAAGKVSSYRPFWVVNGIAVQANRDVVLALADRPDVARVELDRWRRWVTAPPPGADDRCDLPASVASTAGTVEWGVAQVRADEVWASLGISGTGVVVASMDTGVDWLHPALQANYRGYNPHGPALHTYSWYDAVNGTLYPVDDHGHGSHTVGTAVGRQGIGVAPGARWIGVKVLNGGGYGLDSWIHAGFEWLLAPGGDPAQAPDVVNSSWGNDNGALMVFQPDLQALRAAGILAVFSNGNNGPGGGTVGSPASLPEAFAVGATDADDEVVGFSSRGPSPWGEIRPHVAAPGVNVRSSLPGAVYGSMQGTSMAAPHVAGVAALLYAISPTLSVPDTMAVITSTAVGLGSPLPNNDTGWGRVDGFAAAVALAEPGFITGTVKRDGGAPVDGAQVVAVPRGTGGGGATTTGGDGSYQLALAPAIYDLTASAFGYDEATAYGVEAMTGTAVRQDFVLPHLPTGTLHVQVTDGAIGGPVNATITVLDTPLQQVADTASFVLPAGGYVVEARQLGYRVMTATASVNTGQVTAVNLPLTSAPSILLVDSGAWYYGSQVSYFRQMLDDLAYAYDEWQIKHVPDDLPSTDDLIPYDLVVWTAPQDGPGYLGAGQAIVGYLSAGGRLLLTGQDVGLFDGSGMFAWAVYYDDYLEARYVADNAPTRVLEGHASDIFAGLTITIAGPGGADNQDYPDVIAVDDPDVAAPVFAYQGAGCGGLRAGTCVDYRAVYLSFGLEGVDDRSTRNEIVDRSVQWLMAAPPVAGLEAQPASQTHIGPPGTVVTHAMRLRHLGQAGTTDTFNLTLSGETWAAESNQPALTLAPCTSGTVVVSVTTPAGAGWGAQDTLILTARSALSPAVVATATMTTRTPAPILLVDDDRWYPQEEKYLAALENGGFPYDYWHTGSTESEPAQGSPSPDRLSWYPLLVWFTGYDWYRPVTEDEAGDLQTYLDGGGRLFLSSQDFLYYHQEDDLARNYLGVLGYTEFITPTLARGVPEDPVGGRFGPYSLYYPFRNWSDGVESTLPGVTVPLRDQKQRPIALARQGDGYRTLFLSFPFEALPAEGRDGFMARAVGWLSWLGRSTLVADRGAASSGDVVTYTVALHNDGPEAVTASLSNTLPVSVSMLPGSLSGGAVYSDALRRISWDGGLAPAEGITFTYRATVAQGLADGTPIVNSARIGLESQAITFTRDAIVRANAPDLSPSTFACGPSPSKPGTTITCTLVLANLGADDADQATAAAVGPQDVVVMPGSLVLEGGGVTQVLTNTVAWTGSLGVQASVTATYRLTLPADYDRPPVFSTAYLADGIGGAWERDVWTVIEPLRIYFPLVFR